VRHVRSSRSGSAFTVRRYLKRLSGASLGGTTIYQGIILLAGIGSGITLARSLGPEGRGELAIALLWPGILVLFGDFGLGFAFSYYAGKGKERMDDLWSLAIVSGLLSGGAIATIGWPLIPHFVRTLQGTARQELGWALLSVPIVLANGFQAYLLLGRGLVAEYNRIRIISALSYLVFVAGVALTYAASVHNFVLSYLLAQSCGLVLCTALTVNRFRPRFHLSASLFQKVFSYGIKTQVGSIAAQTNLRADQAIMSIILTPSQLGLYVVAVSISGVLSPLMSALAVVILPRTTHASSDVTGALIVARHVKLACLLSLPVLIVSVALMPWVLPAFFGRGYSGAILSARILVIAGLFQGLNAVLGNSLRGLGRPALPAVAEGIGMLVTLALLFLLLPRFGIVGAAIASFFAYLLVAVGEFALVARAGGMKISRLVFSPIDDPLIGRSRQLLRALTSR
jgi:O-antigen/teichoic acid export membrane protein